MTGRDCRVGDAAVVLLPQVCPELDCGCWLQPCLDPARGVEPHYTACHPGRPVPVVVT